MSSKLLYLIEYLISEKPEYKDIEIPEPFEERKKLWRSLMNVRAPEEISPEYLPAQLY